MWTITFYHLGVQGNARVDHYVAAEAVFFALQHSENFHHVTLWNGVKQVLPKPAGAKDGPYTGDKKRIPT